MDLDNSDGGLVVRARLGDRDAFNMLMSKYRHRVMKLSMRYTRNRADAEDVVQETFIRAYGALSYFRGDAAFYSWLHRIAINSAKTALALRARQSGFMVANGHTGMTDESPEALIDLDTPEDLALTEELCGRGKFGDRGTVRRAARGDCVARVRGPQLFTRGGRDGLSGRHRALTNFPGARGDQSPLEAHS